MWRLLLPIALAAPFLGTICAEDWSLIVAGLPAEGSRPALQPSPGKTPVREEAQKKAEEAQKKKDEATKGYRLWANNATNDTPPVPWQQFYQRMKERREKLAQARKFADRYHNGIAPTPEDEEVYRKALEVRRIEYDLLTRRKGNARLSDSDSVSKAEEDLKKIDAHDKIGGLSVANGQAKKVIGHWIKGNKALNNGTEANRMKLLREVLKEHICNNPGQMPFTQKNMDVVAATIEELNKFTSSEFGEEAKRELSQWDRLKTCMSEINKDWFRTPTDGSSLYLKGRIAGVVRIAKEMAEKLDLNSLRSDDKRDDKNLVIEAVRKLCEAELRNSPQFSNSTAATEYVQIHKLLTAPEKGWSKTKLGEERKTCSRHMEEKKTEFEKQEFKKLDEMLRTIIESELVRIIPERN